MQFDHLKRREFVALLGVSAGAWPFVAYAAVSRPRVGVLTLLSPRDERGRIAAFVAGMRERGYVPGQTLDIDYRYAEGDNERLPPLARELVTLAPGVIFAGEPSAARAVKALAPNLPIVCPILGDHLPDLFASYARPGGSVTGMASIVEGVNAKLVELASDALPGLTRVGLLANPAGANHALVESQVVAAARGRGMITVVEQASQSDALAPALDRMAKAGAQVVIVQPNGLFINERSTILRQALAARLPSIFDDRDAVEAGGFMSYGVNNAEGSRHAAAFVEKILKGAKPADLPIEFSTKIELVINLKTARTLGLDVPATLLARADEVIE
jgi:putative tryptophan/tyrosine transport system substrate-binding protein